MKLSSTMQRGMPVLQRALSAAATRYNPQRHMASISKHLCSTDARERGNFKTHTTAWMPQKQTLATPPTQPDLGASVDGRKQVYVADDKGIELATSLLANDAVVSFDTEFSSFPSYYPQLQLIQLSGHQGIVCIDCVALPTNKLQNVVQDTMVGREIVLHSASMDAAFLAKFVKDWGATSFFDTQVACNILGIGSQIGLGAMVEHVLKLKLDKSQSLTDWRRRPLTADQLQYAMGDVEHLHAVRDTLLAQLESTNKLSWFKEDMAVLLEQTQALSTQAHQSTSSNSLSSSNNSSAVCGADGKSESPFKFRSEVNAFQNDPTLDGMWTKVRRLKNLSGNHVALSVLQQLAKWREVEARTRNVDSRVVMSDDTLLTIAKTQTADISTLETLQGIRWSTLEFSRQDMCSAIEFGLSQADQVQLTVPRQFSLSLEEEDRMAQLTTAATTLMRARAHQYSVSYLGLVKWEEQQQIGPWLMDLDVPDEELSFLSGWRSEVVGHDLRKLKAGEKIAFDFSDGVLSVV
eukprot:m.268339 g.268339  ORF g.268339 m.268339 type:complete len:520 (-) comp15656_c0_seq5:2803-4362(-)